MNEFNFENALILDDRRKGLKKKKKVFTKFRLIVFLALIFLLVIALFLYNIHLHIWTLKLNLYFLSVAGLAFVLVVLAVLMYCLSETSNVNKSSCMISLQYKVNLFLVICYIFTLSFYNIEKVSFIERYSYTREKWALANVDERNVMIDSFLEQYDLYTFDEEMILYHLGEPYHLIDTSNSRREDEFKGLIYSYYLGYNRGFIDPVTFDIYIKPGELVSYYIFCHH